MEGKSLAWAVPTCLESWGSTPQLPLGVKYLASLLLIATGKMVVSYYSCSLDQAFQGYQRFAVLVNKFGSPIEFPENKLCSGYRHKEFIFSSTYIECGTIKM